MKTTLFTEVKRHVTIIEILDRYLGEQGRKTYKQTGDQLRGPCIYCENGKQTSLSINTEKNCFRAFCCGVQGNIFDFVAAKEFITTWEACERIAQWFGLSDDAEDSAENDAPANPPLTFELKNIDAAHENCERLGVSAETIKLFGVGVYSGRGVFKDHVVLPIHNHGGDLVAYAGARVANGKMGQWQFPEKFQPDLVLFNAHRVAKLLENARETPILVPNLTDVLRFHDKGYPAVLAYFGDFPSQAQLNMLRDLNGQCEERVLNYGPAPKIELGVAYTDTQGNTLIPFERLSSGEYRCCVIEPAIDQIPIVNNSDHVTRKEEEISELWVRDQTGRYTFTQPAEPETVCHLASEIIMERLQRDGLFTKPSCAGEFLCYKIGSLEHEVFACLFLDSRNQLIRFEILFRGTINAATVYAREVVKRALQLNASSIICGHNHPSADPEPSVADLRITTQLRDALKLIDVDLFDHIVVGGTESVSLAERGLV